MQSTSSNMMKKHSQFNHRVKYNDAEHRIQHVDGSWSFFSLAKSKMSISGSKSLKNVPFQAHFLTSRRLAVDVSWFYCDAKDLVSFSIIHSIETIKPSPFHKNKRVKVAAQKSSTYRRTPTSERLLEANRRMEAIQKAISGGRIVAREDDVDNDIFAAFTTANCSECHGLGAYGTFLIWQTKTMCR
jgi:hypothetical protein